MVNFLLTVLAIFLLLMGFISLVTPIPGAILMIAGGLTLLIYSSPKARLCIQWIRSRSPRFHKVFSWIEKKVGTKVQVIGEVLKDTQPLEDAIGEGLSHKEYVKTKLEEERQLK